MELLFDRSFIVDISSMFISMLISYHTISHLHPYPNPSFPPVLSCVHLHIYSLKLTFPYPCFLKVFCRTHYLELKYVCMIIFIFPRNNLDNKVMNI